MTENALAKRDDENNFEYHKRLVYGKLKDKTLADYDYGELAKYLYNKELASDEARKRMYGSCQTLEVLDGLCIDSITDDKVLNELEQKKLELQKERQRFFDQRREYNKLVNNEGRRDHLYHMLAEAAKNLPVTVGKAFDTKDHVPYQFTDNDFILVLSDWHFGMITDNIWNTYNMDICRERVADILENAIDRIVLHKCRRGHVVLLGDFIHGSIRTSTRVASEELVADQLMQVSEIIAQFIAELAKYVESIDVYSTFGNHARTVAKKEDNMHMDNMERIIPWWLSERMTADCVNNVTVHNDNTYEFLLFKVCGWGFCASHGDLDDIRTAPRMLSNLFHKVMDINISYIFLGDKHHEESFEEMGVEALLCGSLCGTDEYANKKRLYSDPSQLLLIVNPNNGVDARYKLHCNKYLVGV